MKEWKLDAITLAKSGMSWRKIAKNVGVAKSTVSDFLRQYFGSPVEAQSAKILLLDIETAPVLAAVWGLWKQNVGLNMIERDWFLMSYAARWLDSDQVFYDDCRENIENDFDLLEQLHLLLSEADIVIAHNVEFDIPKIRARMVYHGMNPPSPFKTYCTLRAAKKIFKFTSNKLEYLADHLGVSKKYPHSKFPGYQLWAECLKGNEEAWDELQTYNIGDIEALEGVYLKLRIWDQDHPNVAVQGEDSVLQCPKCGSTDLTESGTYFTNYGKYRQYQCVCGAWSRSRYTINSIEKRKNLLK